jgi:hypothetical protein
VQRGQSRGIHSETLQRLIKPTSKNGDIFGHGEEAVFLDGFEDTPDTTDAFLKEIQIRPTADVTKVNEILMH